MSAELAMTTAPRCLTPGPRTGWSTWRVTRGESESGNSDVDSVDTLTRQMVGCHLGEGGPGGSGGDHHDPRTWTT